MASVLVAWLGTTDLRASAGDEAAGEGPLASAARASRHDEVTILSSHDGASTARYVAWLRAAAEVPVVVHAAALSGPTEYREIHDAAVRAVLDVRQRHGRDVALTFHLSAGTGAMAAVWILLAKGRFPARLIESSRAHGVREAQVPFEISAELLPELLSRADGELIEHAAEWPSGEPAFDRIVHRSQPMRRLLDRARRVALRRVPVLIEGESGTGKELIARAIHAASPRAAAPFIAVNCGAIPENLVESELFGHERGAFTGAVAARAGHFREAHGGTLFLDEIGELPLAAQVKLLRALQEGEVTAVGASRPVAVDVRVMAATHRDLLADVRADRFRADLFYRLAVAVLRVPPLRERPGDLLLLVERTLEQINAEHASDPGFTAKRLTPSAMNVLASHAWPGNVRELGNTLRRAALWSRGTALSADDVRDALLEGPAAADVLGRPLSDGFSLPELLAEVARHYLERALSESEGNRTRAASKLGLASHQTLANWMARYGVKPHNRVA